MHSRRHHPLPCVLNARHTHRAVRIESIASLGKQEPQSQPVVFRRHQCRPHSHLLQPILRRQTTFSTWPATINCSAIGLSDGNRFLLKGVGVARCIELNGDIGAARDQCPDRLSSPYLNKKRSAGLCKHPDRRWNVDGICDLWIQEAR
ncbi:hypothetical protein KCV03_g101, partial [Aureobasidium melanogenum]